MRTPILLSLSLFLTACGTAPQVDKPDLGIAPTPCPPELQADLPAKPERAPGSGIVKPPVGSQAAEATALHLNYDAAVEDFALNVLMPRVAKAKAFCATR
jgi:hypothetical protein